MKKIALQSFTKNVGVNNAVFAEILDLTNHINPDRVLNTEL